MSKLETPLTRRYWEETGGSLIEEFLAVPGSTDRGKRLLDGVIIPGEAFERKSARAVDLEGKNIIVVPTKVGRLGMYFLGQALFSARLMERFRPVSIRSVAICTKGDAVLEPLAKEYGIEVVIYPAAQQVAQPTPVRG